MTYVAVPKPTPHPNLVYVTPANLAQQHVQPQGADKYHGDVASGYDAKREQSPKWLLEQSIITGWLGEMPNDWEVFDCPCGTGRFFEFYQSHPFKQVWAMDKSQDMLGEASKKITGDRVPFQIACGDVRNIPVHPKTVDVAVMCRLTRWLSPEDCQKAIKELQRIARHKIIFTARVANHPHARSIELFEAAMDGWKITRNVAGVDLDYRIIMLEPI